ncbi:MAG: MGH1-like glycoside hydrolase domain-containing protein [Inquilinaceae bacterium]
MAPSLDEQAIAILRANDRGGYTVPTAGLYPFQWNWDSCLVALGWATFDEPRAWAELDSLFGAQWDDGMVPHIVFHKPDPGYFPGPEAWGTGRTPASSGITQPPVAATVVRRLVEGARDAALARDAASRLLPRLMAWHRWFMTARDTDGDGLVAMIHPWETGRDNSPDWDVALGRVPVEKLEPYERRDTTHVDSAQRPRQAEYDRYMSLVQGFRALNYDPARLVDASPFRMADVGVNAILLRAHRDLAWLARTLGDTSAAEEADRWTVRTADGFGRLWHAPSDTYRSFDLAAGTHSPVTTVASFLPLSAGLEMGDRAARLAGTLEAWLGRVRFGVPSADPAGPDFDQRRYWRGPVWAIVNYLLVDGLAAHGLDRLVRRVTDDTATLIRTAGFYEYFDPTDGTGLGGDRFTWTAAMWLAWLNRLPADVPA